MRVRLDVMWFDHQGKRWRAGEHDMPASYEEKLPEGSIILNKDGEPLDVAKPKDPTLNFKKK